MIATLRRMLVRLRHSEPVGAVLDYERRWQRYVRRRYGLATGLPVLGLEELVPDLDQKVSPYTFMPGTASPLEMAVLRGLAGRFEPCHYLEIGTFRGESVANVAQVADRCVTVCLPEATMADLGLSAEEIAVHGMFSRGLANVEHVAHDSRTLDFATLGGPFDLVFVDGDHAPETVRSDTVHVLAELRDERSVVLWHDYGFSPEEVRWSVLAGILDGCPADVRPCLYHLAHTTAAVYVRGEFERVWERVPERPTTGFTVAVRSAPLDG
jgi:hypothetical protein